MPSPSRLPSLRRRTQKPSNVFDPRAFLTNAGIGRTILHFNPKQISFSQGARADGVFYIQDGTARLSVVSKQGKEATIALFGPGDFLGEGCIASDQPFHMTTAIATTRGSVLKIDKREMLRTLHEEHRFSDMFVAYVVGRHNRTQSDLVNQLFNSTERASTNALIASPFWEGRQVGHSDPRCKSTDSCGNDRYNPLARECFLEQIQKAWLNRVQRRLEGAQFSAQCCPRRVAWNRRPRRLDNKSRYYSIYHNMSIFRGVPFLTPTRSPRGTLCDQESDLKPSRRCFKIVSAMRIAGKSVTPRKAKTVRIATIGVPA